MAVWVRAWLPCATAWVRVPLFTASQDPTCRHLTIPAPPCALPPARLQNPNNTALMAQVQALPNWNSTSDSWKPMLDLSQGVAVQQSALLSIGAQICGANPTGDAVC